MKKVLIVVDMQNDFVDGALGTPEAVKILPGVRQKVLAYRKAGVKIIFTRDTHDTDYLQTQEGKNLPVEHCIKDTFGWNICTGLAENGDDVVDKYSFGSRELPAILKEYTGIEEIELVGVCTDICVISNALILKAFLPEVKIIVDAGCCAGVSEQSHKTALEAMKMCQIDVR